jgi:hypothetical protein
LHLLKGSGLRQVRCVVASPIVKKKRRRADRPRKFFPSPPKGVWHLVVIDNGPIRRRALDEYWSAERRLEKIRTELEVFETNDMPAFNRWEARTFGALLTEIRETESAAAEKRRIVEAIEEEVMWSGCTRVTAYRRVMEVLSRSAAGEEEEQDEPGWGNEDPEGMDPGSDSERMFGETDLPPGFDVRDFDRLPRSDKAKFRAFYESIAEMFEMMTGLPAPDLDKVLERERARSRGGEEQVPDGSRRYPERHPEKDRSKTLYRKLVRQLHPDRNRNQGWRERELWHEVQAAYQARDLDRLEAAAGRVEMGLNGASAALSVHTLLRLTGDLLRELAGLKKQAARARRHSAWKFSTRANDLAAMEARHRGQLELLKASAREELLRWSAILDDLAARAKRRPKKPGSRKTSGKSESPFQMHFFGEPSW